MSASAFFSRAFIPKAQRRHAHQWSKIMLFEEVSPWVRDCVERISELSQLPANWDSYGSNAITENAIRAALRFLVEAPLRLIAEPSVSPVPGGGIGFHWRVESRDLELEFSPSGAVEFLAVEKSNEGDKHQEGVLQDMSNARLWRWLAGETA